MSGHDEVVLTGLDGTNPLAFLAGIGALCAGDASWRLSWRRSDTWRPVLHGVSGPEAVVATLLADLTRWRTDAPAIAFDYVKHKAGVPDKNGKIARDLKPPPPVFRELLLRSQARGVRWADADFFVAFGSEFVTDSSSNLKPTALHFTTGNQEFIAIVQELLRGNDKAKAVGEAELTNALFGPWAYTGALKTLRWDGATSRDYALRAGDPSKDKTATVPGADWLGFRAMELLPTAPRGARLVTTRFDGGWKTTRMTWPMWMVPATRRVIGSLLTSRGLATQSPAHRAARGIGDVLTATVGRTGSGGYGSFSPGRIAGRDDRVPG